MKNTSSMKPIAVVIAWALSACSAGGMDSASSMPVDAGTDAGTTPRDPEARLIEESDIYKLVDEVLYVQNEFSGLSTWDVSVAEDPTPIATLEDTAGEAGEIYVRDERVFVIHEERPCSLGSEMSAISAGVSATTEAVAVTGAPSDPTVAGRYCVPGRLVASRVVGDVLYMVTSVDVSTTWSHTWLLSIDVSAPDAPAMADFRNLEGDSREIHVTREAIFVAQEQSGSTRILYVDISDPDGVMQERGTITVSGVPQGRWHMDAWDGTFRIVTYSGIASGTNLHVIDVSNPDVPLLLGSITGLAPNEELWATRFVGDTAYVVTYLREPPPSPGSDDGWRWSPSFIGDPLWVISLEDPSDPEVQGELHIPGWSNFIYPRDGMLVTAGRGTLGNFVAVSMFDVRDPYDPREVERIEFGSSGATSEANDDHRGAAIIEDGVLGSPALVVVPYTDNVSSGDTCTPHHKLQLIDLEDDDIDIRGELGDSSLGRVVRTFPVEDTLYTISSKRVGVVDVSDRDHPETTASADLGGSGVPDVCVEGDIRIDPLDDDYIYGFFPWSCSVGHPSGPASAAPVLVLLLAAIALLSARRR